MNAGAPRNGRLAPAQLPTGPAGPALTSALGLREALSLVVGRIIGSGIFRTPGPIMALTGSPHDAESHSQEKEVSKHLTVKQMQALATGVRMCPAQSGRSLRRNLANFSPEKRIDPLKIRNVRRKVAKFRADLTLEQLDHVKIDDFFGSLVRFADAKWFPDLITEHNNED